jgi:hypothetical protein
MRTELEVSRIFVQFIASGVRHARIDSYRKAKDASENDADLPNGTAIDGSFTASSTSTVA